VIIAIAANKEWLQDSPLKNTWGNFTLVAEGTGAKVCNLEEINVDNNWTLDVYLDEQFQFSLEPNNVTALQTKYNYSYDRDDFWNYNREVIGLNLSLICDWAGMNDSINFEVKARAADGWASPHGSSKRPGFTEDEVYYGLENDSRYWGYVNESETYPDGVALPEDINDGKPIIIAYSQRLLGESNPDTGYENPVWSEQQKMGIAHGPYTVIMPGGTRDKFVKWIYQIEINTIPDVDFDYNDTEISVNDWIEFSSNRSLYYPATNYTFSWFINSSTDGDPNITGSTVEWQFTEAGNYTISLVVKDKFDGSEGVKTREELIEVT
jgi:hypothetical protein